MKKKYEICSMFFHRSKINPFLNRIITCDENGHCMTIARDLLSGSIAVHLQDSSQNLFCNLKRFCSQFGGLKRG